MRYKKLNESIGAEVEYFDVKNIEEKKDEQGVVIEEARTVKTPTDEYFVGIVLTIQDTGSKTTDYPEGFVFNETVIVKSHNKQTGFDVDDQREVEVENFMKTLNK